MGFSTESRILQIQTDVRQIQKDSNKRLLTLEKGVHEILHMLGASPSVTSKLARAVSSGSGLVAAAQGFRMAATHGKDQAKPSFSRSSSFGAKAAEGSSSACPSPGPEDGRSRRRKKSSFAKNPDASPSPMPAADASPTPPAASSVRQSTGGEDSGALPAAPSSASSSKRCGKKPGEWGVVL